MGVCVNESTFCGKFERERNSHTAIKFSTQLLRSEKFIWVIAITFAKMSSRDIYYSEKYYDDVFEYRHVIVPKDMAKLIATKKHLMPETEWRAMGIQQSQGWIHYMYHKPEPHVLLFRRPKTT